MLEQGGHLAGKTNIALRRLPVRWTTGRTGLCSRRRCTNAPGPLAGCRVSVRIYSGCARVG
jgi:hypothetical protein